MSATQASTRQVARDAKPKREVEADGVAPGTDFIEHVKAFSKDHPEVAALWCFGIGFIVAWKIKPW